LKEEIRSETESKNEIIYTLKEELEAREEELEKVKSQISRTDSINSVSYILPYNIFSI